MGTSGCELTVQEWQATLQNVPRGMATFNDIVMDRVDITYSWQIPGPPNFTRSVGLGGVTVPVDGVNTVSFFPISSADLLNPAVEGNTADLLLTFLGTTVGGTAVSVTAQTQLNVEACP